MNVAILGYGAIVPDFLEAVKPVSEFNISALFGRPASRERVERFAKEHGINRIFFDYDELLKDESIDVIYVALPNNLHYEYARKALEHGKHVIVEKPFAGTLREAKDLIETASRNNHFVLEAISNQYLPTYQQTKELLPKLGSIKLVVLNFSQYSHRYDDFKEGKRAPVFDPEQDGGVLVDLNVYNIHFCVGLFGMPESVHYYPNMERGIDTSGILIMSYPEFSGCCIAAKSCGAPFSVSIEGDEGCIYSDKPANVYSSFSLIPNKGPATEYSPDTGHHRMYCELRAFADMLMTNDAKAVEEANAQTLKVMEILEQARRQAGLLKT